MMFIRDSFFLILLVNVVLWKPERHLFRSIKTTEHLRSFVNDEKARLDFVSKYLNRAHCPQTIVSLVQGCLQGGAVARPNFKTVINVFNDQIFINAAIHEKNASAMSFWRNYDLSHEVSFDEFLAAMTNEALLVQGRSKEGEDEEKEGGLTSEFPLSRDKVHFLHLLFVNDSAQSSTVSLEQFGKVCAILGPFDLPSFVTRVSSFMIIRLERLLRLLFLDLCLV